MQYTVSATASLCSILQVFTGQHHHIGIELEGIGYEVTLKQNHDDESGAIPRALPSPPGGDLQSRLQQQAPLLPDITLAGPLELRLPKKTAVSLYLPHSTDIQPTSRIVLATGAVVKIKGLSAMQLRWVGRPLPK
jgi:hypothetical protein